MGNTALIEYGIQQENNDYRVHVGFASGYVVVFPTASGRHALARNRSAQKRVSQAGCTVITGVGNAVPYRDIPGHQLIRIPPDILRVVNCRRGETTTVKGKKAVRVVREMLKRKLIFIPWPVEEVTDAQLQIQGLDIMIHLDVRIQVKCDWKAGPKERGGTGNVFLQTHECNPLKRR